MTPLDSYHFLNYWLQNFALGHHTKDTVTNSLYTEAAEIFQKGSNEFE